METETATWSEFPKERKATADKHQGQKIEINPKSENHG